MSKEQLSNDTINVNRILTYYNHVYETNR